MPALAKPPVILPRFVPHNGGAIAGAGSFSRLKPSLTPKGPTSQSEQPTPQTIDHLAHDARNILSGLMLYCELLAAPGVLTAPHAHYAKSLEGIAEASAQILEKILTCAAPQTPANAQPLTTTVVPFRSVSDVASELRHLQPLLAAIAGPSICLSVATMPCPGRTALAVEDLTRILVNLVRNASDAMPAGGNIRITAQYGDGFSFLDSTGDSPMDAAMYPPAKSIAITVADDGPGIPPALRQQIFKPGFTSKKQSGDWPIPRRRGLGLSIVRNLVQAAGGTVRALANHQHGARFDITLPVCESVTSDTCLVPSGSVFPADSHAKGCIECQ